MKLPKETADDNTRRAEAIEAATRAATETPLCTARAAAEVLEYLESLLRIGNVNARSDGATGAQFAFAALKAAQYNVLTNLPGLKDRGYAAACRAEVDTLVRRSEEALRRIDLSITTET